MLGFLAKCAAAGGYLSWMRQQREKEEALKKLDEQRDKDLSFLQIWDINEEESFILNRVEKRTNLVCICRSIGDNWYSKEITCEVFWDKYGDPVLIGPGKYLYIDKKKCTPPGENPDIFWSKASEEQKRRMKLAVISTGRKKFVQ